jgi:hypothetical protein
MFREYDVVKLKRDILSHNLLAGARGTVLLVYLQPPRAPAYEIEFTDGQGSALAILAVQEEDLERVRDNQE